MSRYLWAIGKSAEAFQPGDTLADRYLCKGRRIFVDLKTSVLPGNVDEVPESFLPYLKLSPYQIHIPQVYDWVQPAPGASDVVLLLDQAPLYAVQAFQNRGFSLQEAANEVQLFPTLTEVWQAESPLRQLHWLWQMANLWQHMSAEGVASSLLRPELLRTEGPILRLLELRFDGATVPLSALGEFWLSLVQTAQPSIQEPLQQICQQLVQGKIRTAEELVASLDQLLAVVGQSQQTRVLQIATLSDRGPSRQRNEDSCYPDSGTVTTAPPATPLVIVCDGIGGHQGGDVASNMAIQAIEERILSLQSDRLDPTTLSIELEKAVCAANDRISQQNDAEQRLDRQRMGTTVVMGLARAHELYVTHVGDSRAYWITRWGCHQITQDDDVASREVRLGYSTYSQALQQPSAGSLVQALGMASSTNLYPTVQRFILDEDSVFLLCSDGLSDNDRVEEHWETLILPLLNQGYDLAKVSQELVRVANELNGYDNTTVGIIHCQISGTQSPATLQASTTVVPSSSTVQLPPTARTRRAETAIFSPTATPGAAAPASTTTEAPTLIPKPSDYAYPTESRSSNWKLLLGIIALTGVLGALLATVFWQNDRLNPVSQVPQPQAAESPEGQTATPNSPSPNSPIPLTAAALESGAVLQASQTLDVQTVHPAEAAEPTATELATIPEGSLVYVINKALIPQDGQEDTWLQLTVCDANSVKNLEGIGERSIGISPNTPEVGTEPTTIDELPPNASPNATDLTPLKQGQNSWVRESDVLAAGFNQASGETEQRNCENLPQFNASPNPRSGSRSGTSPQASPELQQEPISPEL
jgi:protein phosphatase